MTYARRKAWEALYGARANLRAALTKAHEDKDAELVRAIHAALASTNDAMAELTRLSTVGEERRSQANG